MAANTHPSLPHVLSTSNLLDTHRNNPSQSTRRGSGHNTNSSFNENCFYNSFSNVSSVFFFKDRPEEQQVGVGFPTILLYRHFCKDLAKTSYESCREFWDKVHKAEAADHDDMDHLVLHDHLHPHPHRDREHHHHAGDPHNSHAHSRAHQHESSRDPPIFVEGSNPRESTNSLISIKDLQSAKSVDSGRSSPDLGASIKISETGNGKAKDYRTSSSAGLSLEVPDGRHGRRSSHSDRRGSDNSNTSAENNLSKLQASSIDAVDESTRLELFSSKDGAEDTYHPSPHDKLDPRSGASDRELVRSSYTGPHASQHVHAHHHFHFKHKIATPIRSSKIVTDYFGMHTARAHVPSVVNINKHEEMSKEEHHESTDNNISSATTVAKIGSSKHGIYSLLRGKGSDQGSDSDDNNSHGSGNKIANNASQVNLNRYAKHVPRNKVLDPAHDFDESIIQHSALGVRRNFESSNVLMSLASQESSTQKHGASETSSSPVKSETKHIDALHSRSSFVVKTILGSTKEISTAPTATSSAPSAPAAVSSKLSQKGSKQSTLMPKISGKNNSGRAVEVTNTASLFSPTHNK
jgi:hypothetical protein